MTDDLGAALELLSRDCELSASAPAPARAIRRRGDRRRATVRVAAVGGTVALLGATAGAAVALVGHDESAGKQVPSTNQTHSPGPDEPEPADYRRQLRSLRAQRTAVLSALLRDARTIQHARSGSVAKNNGFARQTSDISNLNAINAQMVALRSNLATSGLDQDQNQVEYFRREVRSLRTQLVADGRALELDQRDIQRSPSRSAAKSNAFARQSSDLSTRATISGRLAAARADLAAPGTPAAHQAALLRQVALLQSASDAHHARLEQLLNSRANHRLSRAAHPYRIRTLEMVLSSEYMRLERIRAQLALYPASTASPTPSVSS